MLVWIPGITDSFNESCSQCGKAFPSGDECFLLIATTNMMEDFTQAGPILNKKAVCRSCLAARFPLPTMFSV